MGGADVKQRFLSTLLAGGLIAAAGAMPPVLSAQSHNGAAAKSYVPPKTPWGDPDIQGMWPSAWMQGVRLERDPKLGDRAELTDEEFAVRQKAVEAARTGNFALGAW